MAHADKGKDALDTALKETPLLVILDLMLPDISGEELCLKLKEIADTPVIMLTAKASEEERVAGFALGADAARVKASHRFDNPKKGEGRRVRQKRT